PRNAPNGDADSAQPCRSASRRVISTMATSMTSAGRTPRKTIARSPPARLGHEPASVSLENLAKSRLGGAPVPPRGNKRAATGHSIMPRERVGPYQGQVGGLGMLGAP